MSDPSSEEGLRFFRSNSSEMLARVFLAERESAPIADPFAAEAIMVASTGMRDWLKRRLADETGIAANLSFLYSGSLSAWMQGAAHLLRERDGAPPAAPESLGGDAAGEARNPWVPDRMVWAVATELLTWSQAPDDGEANAPRAALLQYLQAIRGREEEASEGHIQGPLFALAMEIASLFHRYHSWRPEMIAAWRQGRDHEPTSRGELALPAHLAWQPQLWRSVRERLRTQAEDPLGALRAIGGAAHDPNGTIRAAHGPGAPNAEQDEALREVLPPRLTLFALESLSVLQLAILRRIAQVIRVDWYLPAPTPFFLGDQTPWALRLDRESREQARKTYLHVPAAAANEDERRGDATAFDELEGSVSPLMAAMGRVPRATQLMLETHFPNAPEGEVDFRHPLAPEASTRDAEAAPPQTDAAATDDPPSMLHRLQADVLMLEASAYEAGAGFGPHREDIVGGSALATQRGRRDVRASDRSLGFHACYGPSRQVDAVRDLIVDALLRDETLRPGDFAVMTPDIESFAPLIESTFSAHTPRTDSWDRTGIPGLPYRIQDRSIRSTNPVANILILLMKLADGRQPLSELLSLLSQEPVRTRFDFAAEDVPRIEEWLRGAGARWGMDAAERERHGVPGTPGTLRHTLQSAVERIALGALMPLEATDTTDPDSALPYTGLPRGDALLPAFPLDEAGDRDLASRALLFLETLMHALDELREPRTLDAWIDLISRTDQGAPGLLQRFVRLPPSRAWQKAQIMEELASLQRDNQACALSDQGAAAATIAPRALCAWMELRMGQADRRVTDGLDAVTFCSLLPIRSVPYRWVILLGVDAEIFPRRGTRPAWDLIARSPRPTDRNPRDEDRALFLDAILAARDACHILYSGRSPHSNEAIAPAPPLAELMSMLDRRFDAPGVTAEGGKAEGVKSRHISEWLTRHYPLQPFSPRNFLVDAEDASAAHAPRPPSRHRSEHRAARALLESRTAAASREAWVLELPWNEAPALPPFLRERGPTPLSVDDLCRFFEHPLKEYMRRVVSLTWPGEDERSDDLLPTGTGPLTNTNLMKELYRTGATWSDALCARFPDLPVGPAGRREGARMAAQVASLRERLSRTFGAQEQHPVDLTLDINGVPGAGSEPLRIRLQTTVTMAPWAGEPDRPPALIYPLFSSLRGRRALQGWVSLLAATAAGIRLRGAGGAEEPPTSVVFGIASHKEDSGAILRWLPLPGCDGRAIPADAETLQDWARARLQGLLRVWVDGMCRPLPVLSNEPSDMKKGSVAVPLKKWFATQSKKGADGGTGHHPLATWLETLGGLAGISEGLDTFETRFRVPTDRGGVRPCAELRKLLDGEPLFKAKGAIASSWDLEAFVESGKEWTTDTHDPILRRVFGAHGPGVRWPNACLLDTFRVHGPPEGIAWVLNQKGAILTESEDATADAHAQSSGGAR